VECQSAEACGGYFRRTSLPEGQRRRLNQLQNAFLKMVVAAAIATARAFGVPASITIAQAILESGWGTSKLATLAKNYFGVKWHQGEEYAEFPTTEHYDEKVVAKFCKYDTVEESFNDHARLLATLPRYKPAMAVCNDPAKFAQALQDCGYSTAEDKDGNRIYAQMLMRLVRQFNLTQYDIEPPDQPAAQAKEVAA
jgi:flagellum-specific peptidoglycan hydrolase FlgJ